MPGSLSIHSACEESGFLIGPCSPGCGLPRGTIMGCFFPILQPTTSRLTSRPPLNTTTHRNTMIALISKLSFSVSGTQPELLRGCREWSVAASSSAVLSSSLGLPCSAGSRRPLPGTQGRKTERLCSFRDWASGREKGGSCRSAGTASCFQTAPGPPGLALFL